MTLGPTRTALQQAGTPVSNLPTHEYSVLTHQAQHCAFSPHTTGRTR